VEEAGIRVIPVVFGREADEDEGSIITPDKRDVIKGDENENPEDIGKKIIDVAITGII
jgi:hypothetical protein